MGANAQTSVPLFTAGDVLTAANQNLSAGTGVPVFATTTTRDAAFGGTGEKVLAEGQLCYVENLTGVAQLQYYDGAAWNSLSTGALQFITGTTFTTATSFSLPNGTFTSTYRNYRFIVSLTGLTADADFTLRFRAAGTDDSSNAYQYAFTDVTTIATTAIASSNGTTSISMAESDVSFAQRYSLVLDVLAPQVAQTSIVSGMIQYVNKAASATISRTGTGFLASSTQFDSLSFISSVASSISGVYRVYGYSDS